MLWGILSGAGTGRIEGKMNVEKYSEIFYEILLQSAQDLRLGGEDSPSNRTTALSTQSRQCRSGFGTSL
jgi:hypothetical protein